jgi:hypothetical protein
VGLILQDAQGLQGELLIYESCGLANGQFVEDNEDIVFYKNARGLAAKVAVEEGGNVSDSGVDMSAESK